MGFREDAGCAEMLHAVADFVNAFRARRDFRADCDRPCGMQPESFFKILIGVVKDDVLLVMQWRKFGGNFIDQLLKFGNCRCRVCGIPICVCGIPICICGIVR